MMKSAFILLTVVAGAALADQICLPSRFQWQRRQQFDLLKNSSGGFDLTEDFFDHDVGNYRTKYALFTNEGPINSTNIQRFVDLLLISNARKLYTISAVTGSGSVTCDVSTISPPNPTPCLLANATIAGQYFVAGSSFVQIWAESYQDSNRMPIYEDIGLTAQDNVPVSSRHYSPSNFASIELYYNYDLNLDADAFQVPSICATAQVSGPADMAKVKKAFSHLMRWNE